MLHPGDGIPALRLGVDVGGDVGVRPVRGEPGQHGLQLIVGEALALP